ncbi:hypothetical protein GCM10023350_28940 [Nocardioides endophyticus]|uniref:Periplasmic binding protein domain-containing protein n=1 Tax=Nocardioides endophyticus TaxID=1353775 RepID=A0ABP8YXF9_9ACTN
MSLHWKPGTRGAAIGVVAALLLVATACGAGESEARREGSTEQSTVDAARAMVEKYTPAATSYPEITPIDGDVTDLEGKKVWFVPIGAAVPGLRLFGEAMDDAFSRIGIDVQICDGKFVPNAIAACLEQAGTSGADAVVTAYVDYGLVSTAIDRLVDEGIPVLVAGAAAPEGVSNSPMLAFDDTAPDQDLSEQLAASAIIVDSDGTGNVLYIGPNDSPNVSGVGDRAVTYLEDTCPGCAVTRIEYATASLDKLPSQVSAALIKDPSIDYVLTQVDPATSPAVSGAQSAGAIDRLKFATAGADLAGLQDVEAGGHLIADAGYSLVYAGWRFGDGILRMMTGGTPATDSSVLRLFTTDNVQALDLTPEGYASHDWYGDDSFEDGFLEAWGAQ